MDCFSPDNRGESRRRATCKKCIAKQRRAKYETDPIYRKRCVESSHKQRSKDREEYNRRQQTWRKDNPGARLERDYNITLLQFNELLSSQNNKCAICQKIFVLGKATTGPQVDHCHTTGKVRGLLCFDCNTSIGKFKDSPMLCLRAAAYLHKSGEFNFSTNLQKSV